MSLKHEDLLTLLRKRDELHKRSVKEYTDNLVDGVLKTEKIDSVRKMQDELTVLDSQVDVLRRQLEADDKYKDFEDEMRNGNLPVTHGDAEERLKKAKADHSRAFGNYIMRGNAGLSPEDIQILKGGVKITLTEDEKRTLSAEVSKELRALSVGTDALGGYTVPDEMASRIEIAKLAFGGIFRSRATKLQTVHGRQIDMPTTNDTGNTGELLGEAVAAATDEDPVFGTKPLNAYKFSSKIVKISLELLQDSITAIDNLVADMLGERIGRSQSAYFTTGTGSAQPNGVVTGSTLGKTGASGQTTSLIVDDLYDLKHSVDIAYRDNAEFMMNDATLKAIKLLVDSDDRPLWTPGLAVRAPDTIDGDPYVVNNSMAVMAVSAKSVLYGDFSRFWIRTVNGIMLIRFSEKYMDALQIGLLAIQRADSELLNAGTNPIKHYINAAS